MGNFGEPVNWPKAAQALSRRFVDGPIEGTVLKYLERNRGTGLLVACSGGADSVCLLCLLAARADANALRLRVAHYNHAWRGEASDTDAEFVATLAESLGLPCVIEKRPSQEAAFTETTARALRLDFLRKAAVLEGCQAIAFGHQLDDVIETQLQRLARGSASEGLAAPRPVARFGPLPVHLRPLLHLRAGDIRMALQASTIPWREDVSNEDVRIARNALRKQIIPDLSAALQRDASVGAARSRRLLEEDAAALETLARERLPEAFAHARKLDREPLRQVPPALCRRALTEWLSGHGLIGSVGPRGMDLLIEAIISRRRRFRMSAGRAYVSILGDTLTLEDPAGAVTPLALQPVAFEVGESVILSTSAVIESVSVEVDAALRARIAAGGVDPAVEAYVEDAGRGGWAVRAWKPGDRFHALGAPGSKKLKDCFIDRRIPLAERKYCPLVINGSDEIVWVPGFPPAESSKIKPSTKRALRLTYRPTEPI